MKRSTKKHWHRDRFHSTYWLSDDSFSYASVDRHALGWQANIYGVKDPGPFRLLREAKAWVEKRVGKRSSRSAMVDAGLANDEGEKR